MNRKRKNKRGWRIVIYSLLAIVVLLIFGGSAGWFKKDLGKVVEVAKLERRDIIETVSATGKVQPTKEVKISADISGEIIELPVKEGQKVRKGELLVRIRPDQYQRGVERASAGVRTAKAQLANSRAALEQTKANMERARLSYERQKSLYEAKAISKAEMEGSESEYKVMKAQLLAAQHSIEAAEYGIQSAKATENEAIDQLRKTEIYSPIDGHISLLNTALGERVVGTMQMAGTEMMRVAVLEDMEVQAEVNENEILSISIGDSAVIDVDAYRNERFKGVITEIISATANTTLSIEKSTTYKVKVKIIKDSYKHLLEKGKVSPFRSGLTATVTITTNKKENVIVAPLLAVTVRDAETKDKEKENGNEKPKSSQDQDEVVFIYLEKQQIVVKRKVKSGIQDDQYIHLTEGVQEGETIVVGPSYDTISKELNDSDKVMLKPKITASAMRKAKK